MSWFEIFFSEYVITTYANDIIVTV